LKKLAALLITAAVMFTACGHSSTAQKEEVTLFHATDMHYLSQQLTDNNEYFLEIIKSGDGKMTQYCEQICEAFTETVTEQKPDAVLISGDITFNCEKLSHEDFILKLRRIEQAGVDVIAIPGNHDMEYPFSRGYSAEGSYKADYTSEAEFLEYYKDFGPDIAYTVSPDGFSYIVQVGSNIYVAAVYTPQSFMTGIPYAEDETLAWLDTELAKLPQDAKIVSLTHQNILNHYPDDAFSAEYTIANNEELVAIYEKYGVDLNLSGHIHLQHIAETAGGVADISTSSMTICDCHYGVVTVDSEKMSYSTRSIQVSDWAQKNGVTDENLLNFAEYGADFYYETAYPKAMAGLEKSKMTDEEKHALADLWATFNVNYFAGTLDTYYPQMLQSEGYKVWQEKGLEDNWSFEYIKKACDDATVGKTQLHWEKAFDAQQ